MALGRTQTDVFGVGDGSRQSLLRFLQLTGAVVFVIGAAYGWYTKQTGDALFSVLGAILVMLTVLATQGPSMKDIAASLRRHFLFADRNARAFLLAIAVGGTLLIVEIFYDIDFLPEWLDIFVQRLSPSLVVFSACMYIGAFFSKRVFQILVIEQDDVAQTYDVLLYSSLLLTSLSSVPFFWLLIDENGVKPGEAWEAVKLPAVFFLTFIVWSIAFGGCIISRYVEIVWRDRFEPANGVSTRQASDSQAPRSAQRPSSSIPVSGA